MVSSLSVVIPTHNEIEAIPAVLHRLERAIHELEAEKLVSSTQVLIVDDGSSDGTDQYLQGIEWIQTLRLPQNIGYGMALKSGFAAATGDLIAFFDMDDTYDACDLPEMIRLLRENPETDLIMGDRLTASLGMPILRRIGNLFYTELVRALFGHPVRDVCTGFRVFRRRVLDDICALPQDSLNFSLSITLWALKQPAPFRELPIRYNERRGISKLRIVPDGLRFLWTIIRAFLETYSWAAPTVRSGRNK